jgi:hypothetical protein
MDVNPTGDPLLSLRFRPPIAGVGAPFILVVLTTYFRPGPGYPWT